MNPTFTMHVPKACTDPFNQLTKVRVNQLNTRINERFQVWCFEKVHQQVALGLPNHDPVIPDQIRVLHHCPDFRFQLKQRFLVWILHRVRVEQLHREHLIALLVHDFPHDSGLAGRDWGNQKVVVNFLLLIRVV
jgi:hypothetical protein